MTRERYGSWTIEYDPKPIPTRKFDYSFWHDDYDGAPDSFDNRAGTAASIDEAKLEIDIIEDMERDLTPEEQTAIERSLDKFWLMDTAQRAVDLLRRVEPHLDAIICYASTMGEHGPNRLAYDVRAFLASVDGRRMAETPKSGLVRRTPARSLHSRETPLLPFRGHHDHPNTDS